MERATRLKRPLATLDRDLIKERQAAEIASADVSDVSHSREVSSQYGNIPGKNPGYIMPGPIMSGSS